MFLSSRKKTIHMAHESTLIGKYNCYESTLAIHVQKCPRVHPRLTSPRLRVEVARRLELCMDTPRTEYYMLSYDAGVEMLPTPLRSSIESNT